MNTRPLPVLVGVAVLLAAVLTACGATGGTPHCHYVSRVTGGDYVPDGQRPCILPAPTTPATARPHTHITYRPTTSKTGTSKFRTTKPKSTKTRKSSHH